MTKKNSPNMDPIDERHAASLTIPQPEGLPTKEHGEKQAAIIVELLQQLPDGKILLLDFRDVVLVGSSWVREAIVFLVQRTTSADLSGKYIVLINVNQEVRYT